MLVKVVTRLGVTKASLTYPLREFWFCNVRFFKSLLCCREPLKCTWPSVAKQCFDNAEKLEKHNTRGIRLSTTHPRTGYMTTAVRSKTTSCTRIYGTVCLEGNSPTCFEIYQREKKAFIKRHIIKIIVWFLVIAPGVLRNSHSGN